MIQRRTFLPALLAVLLFTLPLHAAPAGNPAPVFDAKTTTGVDFNLAAQKGKYVVLEWTNNMCPFVHKYYESHAMQDLQKKETSAGVVWVSIISSAEGKEGYVDDATANKLTADRGASPTYVIRDPDGKIGRMYNAKTTPHMFVIDKDGTLTYEGAIDSIASADQADIAKAQNYVSAALDELRAGKPVAMASTHSYGCSVKY